MPAHETFYEVMRRHGVTRRSFLKFCSLTAAGLGLGPAWVTKIAHALETYDVLPGHHHLKDFTAGLVQRGYSDDDILKVLGGNFLRVYEQVLK